MEIITLHQKGEYRPIKYMREAARAIIVQGDCILMSHETRDDIWLTPGGGMEDGESYEQCCVREVLEETGKIVRISELFACVFELFEEVINITKYYICDVTGEAQMHPTDGEVSVGAHPEWIEIDRLVALVAEEASYGSRIAKRELAALNAYVEKYKNK